jgi:YtkA-like
MKKSKVLIVIALGVVIAIAVACGTKTGTDAGKVIKAVPAGNLTATLSSSTGQLKQGDQEFTLAFTDAYSKPVDAGAVSLNFHMPAMGGMAAMNDAVTFTSTGTPGVYRGKVNVGMAGEWQGQLAWEGPAGTGKTTFSVSAR